MKNLIKHYSYKLCRLTFLLVVSTTAAQSAFAFDYPEEGDFAAGSKAWSENCTRCHNMRSPTDLRDDQWLTTLFHMRVRGGLTGQETRDILTFLQGSNARTTATNVSTQIDASAASGSGVDLYQGSCMACHGANGKGAIPGLPDFTDTNGRLSKSDSELMNNIVNGFQTPGGVMPMPPRGGNANLSDADIAAILAYVREAFGK